MARLAGFAELSVSPSRPTNSGGPAPGHLGFPGARPRGWCLALPVPGESGYSARLCRLRLEDAKELGFRWGTLRSLAAFAFDSDDKRPPSSGGADISPTSTRKQFPRRAGAAGSPVRIKREDSLFCPNNFRRCGGPGRSADGWPGVVRKAVRGRGLASFGPTDELQTHFPVD